MSTLVQRMYSNEELCESSHYQRSVQYFHGLFGATYHQDRPLIASQRIIESSYKHKRPVRKKSVKENFEDSLINLNVFQLRDDVLKFLSNKSKPIKNPLEEWTQKRKWMKQMKAALISQKKLPEYPELTKEQHHHCGYSYYPSGMKDLHTQPVFHSVKNHSGTHKKSFETTIKPSGQNDSHRYTCKFCCKSSAEILDPEEWYENYKNTVTFVRIPKDHKKKITEKFRAFYAASAALVDTPLTEADKRDIIEASSFALFGNSVSESASTNTNKDMPGQRSQPPAKLYGPDAIALVSGPEFRRRGREVKRSLPKLSASFRNPAFNKNGKSTTSILDSNHADNDDNAKLMSGLNIPLPSSRFRFLDEEFKLSDILETPTPPGTPLHERRLTPVIGSRSISCIDQGTSSSASRPSLNDDEYTQDNNPSPTDRRARGMASVPHIPGAYGDISTLTNTQSQTSIQEPLKPTTFIVGAGVVPRVKQTVPKKHYNPMPRRDGILKDGFLVGGPPQSVINKEQSKSGRHPSIQLPKESMTKLSAITSTSSNPDEIPLSPTTGNKEAPPNSSQVTCRKPSSLINNSPGSKAVATKSPKSFNQIISTVTLSPPRSKTKPVGLF